MSRHWASWKQFVQKCRMTPWPRRMPVDATLEQAAELTPAKLAPLIRELQPRPAYWERSRAAETAAA